MGATNEERYHENSAIMDRGILLELQCTYFLLHIFYRRRATYMYMHSAVHYCS